jgi:hypothetical protein
VLERDREALQRDGHAPHVWRIEHADQHHGDPSGRATSDAADSSIALPRCCQPAYRRKRVHFLFRSPEFLMPRRKKPTRNPWTPADLKTLRKLAGREPAPRIARELKRTESAVRQKASSLGLGLRLR